MRGTFWAMYGLLTLTMLIVLHTNFNIAALVPMGLAVLIANGPAFRLQRSEVFATLYAIVTGARPGRRLLWLQPHAFFSPLRLP